MAAIILEDVFCTVNGTNLSAYLDQVTLNAPVETIDVTAFGVNARVRAGGLEDGSVDLQFLHQADMSLVDGVVWPLRGTQVNVVIRPTSAAASAANPSYTIPIIVADWGFGGGVGEAARRSVSWPGAGAITRATA